MVDGIDDQHIFPTARWSVRKALLAIRQMPIVFFVVLIATGVVSVAYFIKVPDDPKDWSFDSFFLQTAIERVINAFIMTPAIIAIHRFVLLDEITKFYVPNIFSRRFLHFLCLSLAYQAMVLAVGLPMALFGRQTIPIIATLILAICAIWIGVRLILVFPAAAIDAPGASFGNAFADSRGAAWQIFVTLLLIGLLVAAVEIGVRLLIWVILGGAIIAGVLHLLTILIGQLITISAFAAAASRIYRGLADRLKVSVT